MEPDAFDVFLSYNSADKPAVLEIAEALRERGHTVWLDRWELVPGRPWQEALEKAIVTSRTAAVCVGSHGLGPWEKPEMWAFLDRSARLKMPVIPVILPAAPRDLELPVFLRHYTWVDLRPVFSEEGLDGLIWGITGVKPERPSPPSVMDLLATSVDRSAVLGWRSRGEVELIARQLVSEAALTRLYQQSLPWPGLFNKQATTMRHVLSELADVNRQEGGAFPIPLLEFVERLALYMEKEFPTEASSLRAWVDRVRPQVDIAMEEIQAMRNRLRRMASGDGIPFHVLVEVIPDQLGSNRFSLATFSWSREQEFEPIDLLPEDSGPLLLPDIELLLVKLMEEILPDRLPEGTTDVVLEFFLPRELFCWSVDQLKIRQGKDPRPMGIHHRVIVRWRDRAGKKKTWDLYWKRKWRQVQTGTSLLPDSIFWIPARERYRPKELFTELIGSEAPFCLGLAFSPPEISEAEDLLDTILDSGVPVAFWLRQPWANPDDLWQEIERMCRGKCVADLPEVVRKARLAAYGSENGRHVGHHLTLLWDDAERRLPGSVQPPLARPRVEGERL